MTRVLITGASGFIGRPLVRRLREAGFEVDALSRTAQSSNDPLIRWHACDLLRPGAGRDLIRQLKPTHLVGLSWCTQPGEFWSSPESAQWLASSIDLLSCFAAEGGARALFAGSCAEYDWRHGFCSEGLTPTTPTTYYGQCKNLLRQSIATIAGRLGLSWAWARLFFLYGPHEHPARLVPTVIRSLLANKEAPCTEGRHVRDFIHVDDAASALVEILRSDHVGPINVASGEPVPVRTLVSKIGERMGASHLLGFGMLPSAEEPYLIADTRLLFNRVGWRPAISLDRGLSEVIDWWGSRS